MVNCEIVVVKVKPTQNRISLIEVSILNMLRYINQIAHIPFSNIMSENLVLPHLTNGSLTFFISPPNLHQVMITRKMSAIINGNLEQTATTQCHVRYLYSKHSK